MTPILQACHVSKAFTRRRGLRREIVHAVRDVSFAVARGETLGIVGESGCGKSTLARTLVAAHPASSGAVLVEGRPVAGPGSWRRRALARRIQIVFQDPYASLNPRLAVGDAIAEVIRVHRLRAGAAAIDARVDELLNMVGLSPTMRSRLPHAFSGGQRQRLSIARALAAEPAIIVADEPVSALDVSIQAQILNLLVELRGALGLTLAFVSHDLHVVRFLSDRVAVLYLGQVVELAPSPILFASPQHPYTRALLAAIPEPDPAQRRSAAALEGEPADPAHPPRGCSFHTRCPMAIARCRHEPPELRAMAGDRSVRCHLVPAF